MTILLGLLGSGLALAAFIIVSMWTTTFSTERTRMRQMAESAAFMLPADLLDGLAGSEEDIRKPEYTFLKQSLASLRASDPEIRFAYLMGLRNGQLYFIADSEPEGSEDYSPPGQVYTEATDTDFLPITQGKAVVYGPSRDRWGEWISALVPVRDYRTGQSVALLGLDFSAAMWNWRRNTLIIDSLILIVSALALIGVVVAILRQYSQIALLNADLEQSHHLLKALFDRAPVGICGMKGFVHQTMVNEKYLEITGRNRDTLARLSLDDITDPEDRTLDLAQQSKLVAWSISGYNVEKRLVRPDGSSVWVDMAIRALDAGPSAEVTHVCILNDITARKNYEAALVESERVKSVFLDQLPGVAYRCADDEQWTMEFVSNGCEALTGYPASALVGNATISYNEIILEECRSEARDAWNRAIAGRREYSGQYAIRTASGAEKWVLEHGRAEYADDGRVVALEGIILDISAQHQAETERQAAFKALAEQRDRLDELVKERTAELVSARDLAESSNRAKSRFLANMSHEIRTPLNAILGLTHLLAREVTDARQRLQLEKITASGQHLLEIINDVLDISKIESGRFQLEKTDFMPGSVVEEVCAQVVHKAQEKGLELVVDIAGLPRTLRGDGLRIRQILLNLMGNAVKFTEKGSITLKALLLPSPADHPLVRFEVSDTGIGMDEATLASLFRAFTQADVSTTRKFGGTGLGLVISKRLVGLMGGDIGVKSIPGKGSSFWFEIPFGMASPQAAHPGAARLAGLRALVVDDIPEAREALASMLEVMGMRTSSVADGDAALLALQEADAAQFSFDMMLIDYRMPDMDGLELGSRIGMLELSRLPLRILATAFSDSDVRERSKALGFFSVLEKPVTASRLEEALQAAFGRPESGEETARKPGEAEAKLKSRGGGRILLVEDNELNQEVAGELLRSAGMTVELASNGLEAVEMATSGSFELILMDVQMPEMDGLEATRALRRLPGWSSIPILAMTANAFEDDRKACIAAGMNDHVAKPVDAEELYRALVRWLPPRSADESAGKRGTDNGY